MSKLLDNRNNPLSIQNNPMKIENNFKTRQDGLYFAVILSRN
jgi:hypothetical protein